MKPLEDTKGPWSLNAPLTFNDFVGNAHVVEKLKLLTERAANDSFARIPDMAFLGPPGHGKNFCAKILADKLKRGFVEINSTTVRDPFVFRQFIVNGEYISSGVIIHLDECHQLPRRIQDNLLSALEHPRQLHTAHKDQLFKDSLPENLSFIFSTTHAGNLRKPLLSRLETIEFLEYTEDNLMEMAAKYLHRQYGLALDAIEPKALAELAKRSRSGRQTIRFCDNLMRLKELNGWDKITHDAAVQCFKIIGVDATGLTRVDRKMLAYMAKAGSHVGLETLEAVLDISKKEILSNIEPFLLRKGLMVRHTSGRLITPLGKALMEAAND
jgi:Holliday junction DNA helicase RuvB